MPAPVVRRGEDDAPARFLHRQVHVSGSGGNGILGDIQHVERELFHISSPPPVVRLVLANAAVFRFCGKQSGAVLS